MESNIIKLRWIKAFRFFLVSTAILLPFIKMHELGLFQFFALQAIFAAGMVVLEIPAGYFGDKYGWKKAMLWGSLFLILHSLLFIIGNSFWDFAFAELCAAVGFSLFSGSDTAMLFETLADLGKTGEAKKQEGVVQLFARYSEALGGIVAGLVVSISMLWPFYLELVAIVLMVPIVVSLKEPRNSGANSHRKVEASFGHAFNLVSNTPEIRFMILYSALVGVSTLCAIWIFQAHFFADHVDFLYMGVAWAIINLCAGYASNYADRIEAAFGTISVISGIPIIIALSLILVAISGPWVVFIFSLLIQVMRGIKFPLVAAYLNYQLPPESRATVLSMENVVQRLGFVIFGPFVGYMGQSMSLETGTLVIGALALITALYAGFGPLRKLHLHHAVKK